MKKGSYDIALRYLDKAMSVSIRLIINDTGNLYSLFSQTLSDLLNVINGKSWYGFQACPDDADCMIYRGGCLVQLQEYNYALADVDAAIASGCLKNEHTKNTLSRAFTIKGSFR